MSLVVECRFRAGALPGQLARGEWTWTTHEGRACPAYCCTACGRPVRVLHRVGSTGLILLPGEDWSYFCGWRNSQPRCGWRGRVQLLGYTEKSLRD